MANTISLRGSAAEAMVLSNGLTAVLIDVLCLTGAEIAITDWQKEILVRLASHDAAILGDGFTGFDLAEILNGLDPVEGAGFLSGVCSLAQQVKIWSGLPYSPDRELLLSALLRFKGLCQLAGGILPSAGKPFQSSHAYTRCERHGVYLHKEGCIFCNNY
ncbi:MAG: hypothetical protein JNL22_06925 [Bacteroidales bacterium]|nr:hypothetical protein [Bacteroidales bacterium]